jgi:hypothetical protein
MQHDELMLSESLNHIADKRKLRRDHTNLPQIENATWAIAITTVRAKK